MAAKSLIKSAPAFSTDDLWQTAQRRLDHERRLDVEPALLVARRDQRLERQNLKGVWLTHLRKSGLAAKYSAESQPLEYQGVIYVPTGQDDVFAVSADTGEILWEYKAHLDQTISVVCCGWESRGVALGEGKVYIGQLDGSLVALDQKTGQVAWKTQVARWQDGYSVTAAPLYVNGMVVTGVSGGEFGTRGSVTAYDATTGKQKWRFYTIPGPGETGHDTWPQDERRLEGRRRPRLADAVGGSRSSGCCTSRPATQVPTTTAARAPARTCSPRRWSRSTCRPGSSSGGTRWCTTTSGTTTRRARRSSSTPRSNGKDVKGIGEAEKTGWVYLLNRETGKPLFPTPEKKVPQEVNQKTWPTQPFPPYEPVVPHEVSDAQYQRRAEGVDDALEGRPGEGDSRHGDVHALLEDDDGLHAGAAGRHELAAVELQPEHAPLLRLRAERRHRQHRDAEQRDEAG